MFMPSRIWRYIFMQCLSGLIMVLSIFILSIMLVDVVEQLRTVGGDVELSALAAVRLSLMKMPMLIEQTLPFALLVAAMIAFQRLNKRAELSIIRATGMSAWRFLSPLATLALVVGLFTMMVLNPLGAHLSSQFEEDRADILADGGKASNNERRDVWLRQGNDERQMVIFAKRVEADGTTLTTVKMIEETREFVDGQPTERFVFTRRIDADRALLRDGFWQLEGIVENVPDQEPIRLTTLAIPTDLDADKLLDRFASPNTVGFWDLPGFISQTTNAGLDASNYRMRYHGLLAVPALFIAMALIGALVCLRLARLGGTSQLVATGAGAAVGLFFVTQVASSLGSAGAVPPIVAAWAPALCALFTTLAILSLREDG